MSDPAELPEGVRRVPGRRRADGRGWLHVALDAAAAGDDPFGELYVVRAEAPGDRRGDHRHRRMTEWFSVVEGEADLELAIGARRWRLPLSAAIPEAVRVPAGIAHCLVNRGPGPMTAVAWTTRAHDPDDVEPSPTC